MILALGVLLAPATALADAVDACPPGFQESHSGCHFAPGLGEIIVCTLCCGAFALGALLVTILIVRSRREKSSREPQV